MEDLPASGHEDGMVVNAESEQSQSLRRRQRPMRAGRIMVRIRRRARWGAED
jgi:hypothetical protein